MRSIVRPAVWLVAPLVILLGAAVAPAASYGVRDNAHFFSNQAIQQADQIIRQINQRHQRDVLIETIPTVPEEQRQALEADAKQFWEQYVHQRAVAAGVHGVYVLISRNPPHIQAGAGSSAERLFPSEERDHLVQRMASLFRQQKYDEALVGGVRYIQQQMDENAAASGGNTAAQRPPYGSPTGTNVPRGSWGIGGIACVVIGVVLFILLVRGIFGRSGSSYRGYYPPGGYPPQGGYPPGGYQQAGGYYGGGGSGFGRGFLGGLLGGALGGYAADRWFDRGQQQGGYAPPPSSGGDLNSGADTSFSSSGADFGSSDPSSGADFGSGGGGADFGGGGGADFGGGGGGSDFGGGGDSGSSGSDF